MLSRSESCLAITYEGRLEANDNEPCLEFNSFYLGDITGGNKGDLIIASDGMPFDCTLNLTPIVLLGVIGENSAMFLLPNGFLPFYVSTVRPTGRRDAIPVPRA